MLDDLLPVLGVEDRQRCIPADDRSEGEHAPVVAPGTRRIDELEALEVRVGRVLGDPTDDLAGLGVRQEHLDREQVLLRQKDDLASIRTQRRAEVQASRTRSGPRTARVRRDAVLAST